MVSGICIMGEFIFRFKPTEKPDDVVDFKIEPGSLFAMSGYARYECTHEVMRNGEAFHEGDLFERGRVVVLMMRDEPSRLG